MPPRRSHTKSKAGCQRCKKRKIKCDEVHPRCGNCSKHGAPCDFSGRASPSPLAQIASPSATRPPVPTYSNGASPNVSVATPVSSISTIVPFHRPAPAPNAHRTLELKLMHQYTAYTSETFSDSKEERIAWQRAVPGLGYNAPYLTDAILAVAALHLRALNPEDQSYIRASHMYVASSIAQYSSLLQQGASESNAEALFATATLIAFQTCATRVVEVDGAYDLPLSWFHSFQGIKTVVLATWQWLRNSNSVFAIITGQPALQLDMDPHRKTFFAPLLEDLDLQLTIESENARAETKRSYEHAVACLNWAHQKPDRGRIIGFAATVSRRFIELMAVHDPRALVIVSCFFAMIRVIDDAWWLQGVAKREVAGICSLLPPEWWGKMQWPLSIVDHEGPFDEDVWGVSWGAIQDTDNEEIIGEHIDMLADLINREAPPMPLD